MLMPLLRRDSVKRMKGRINKRQISGAGRYVLNYTLLFLVMSAAVFLPFWTGGKSFVNKTDAMTQYLVYLRYMGQYLRKCWKILISGSFAFPVYDFSIGLGDDIGQIVRFHPLDFLSAAVPSRFTEQLYTVILFLRLYLSGLAFSLFASRISRNGTSASSGESGFFCPSRINILTGAMVYVFSGYVLLRVVNHPTYAAPFIVFPLLLIGADKVMRREGILLFPAMVFLGFWSNYYFMYIMSWGLLVYVIVRYACEAGMRSPKGFFLLAAKMIPLYILGLLMSFATLLPTFLRYRQSVRTSSASLGQELFVYADKRRYFAWIINLISPYQSSGNGLNLNYAVIVVPCLVLLFLLPWKIYRSLKLFLIADLCVLMIPALGNVLAVFNRENSRWMFLISVCLGMCVVYTADRFKGMSGKVCLILVLVCAAFTAAAVVQSFVDGGVNRYSISGTCQLCLASFLLILFRKHSVKTVRIIVLLITCTSAAVGGYMTYSLSMGRVSGAYLKAGRTTSKYENEWRSQAVSGIEDDSFYRVEAFGVRHLMDNSAEYSDFHGTSEYNSILNASLIDYMKATDNKGMDAVTTMHGMDTRPVTLNLANVKYYVSRENGTGAVPYGFEEVPSLATQKAKVYECANPLSFGFSYDSFITRKNYEALEPLERELVQLYAAVIEEGGEDGESYAEVLRNAGLKEITTFSYDIFSVNAAMYEMQGAEYKDGKLHVSEKNASFLIEAPERAGYDCYICMEGLIAGRARASFRIEAANLSNKVPIRNETELYNMGREDYLAHVGYSEADSERTIRITFKQKGTYQLSGISVKYVPMYDYNSAIDRLNEESLEDVDVQDGRISGKITLGTPKLVVFSVPWADGWTVEDNGKSILSEKANIMYISALFGAGGHSVRLEYRTPGLTAGIRIALASAAVWAVIAAVLWRKKKRAEY